MGSLFFCFNHQGKARMFVKALTSRGYQEPRDYGRAAFVLTDSDSGPRVSQMAKSHKSQKVFIYPHAARPNILHDIFPEWEHTTAEFAPAPAYAEAVQQMGFSKPI